MTDNRRDRIPFEHYAARYAALDPAEASARCGVRYDARAQAFRMRLLYADYALDWPIYRIQSQSMDPEALALHSLPAQVLLLRFLLEGRKTPGTGRFLPFRELPWGGVYQTPFENRCLKRAARAFGPRLDAFRAALSALPALPLRLGDAAFQIEFIPGCDVRLILWEGDDEFPPSAQILFSDTFPSAFTAEDCAVLGDILISYVQRRMG